MPTPIFLSETDLADLLDMPGAITELERMLAGAARGDVVNRSRQRIPLGAAGYNLMAAGWAAEGVVGLKVYTVSRHGAPMHVMLHAADGTGLLAVLAAGRLSGLRTGGMTGLAVRRIARDDDSDIAVIGAGFQAGAQVRGLAAALPGTRIRVHARDSGKLAEFVSRLSEETGADIVASGTLAEVTAGVRAIVTITNASQPILGPDDVEDGTLVVAAGNNTWMNSEIAPELFERASLVVVDDLDQARLESGEFMRAIDRGLVNPTTVRSIAEVIADGTRAPADGVTVFEWQGIAAADVAIATVLYRRAIEAGRGLPLE